MRSYKRRKINQKTRIGLSRFRRKMCHWMLNHRSDNRKGLNEYNRVGEFTETPAQDSVTLKSVWLLSLKRGYSHGKKSSSSDLSGDDHESTVPCLSWCGKLSRGGTTWRIMPNDPLTGSCVSANAVLIEGGCVWNACVKAKRIRQSIPQCIS